MLNLITVRLKFLCFRKLATKVCHSTEMKYLNVAEKNDAAKTIAGQLSNGTARRVSIYIYILHLKRLSSITE